MWKNQLKNKLESLKAPIEKILEEFSSSDFSNNKSDGSPVTKVDLFITSELEEFFRKHLPEHTYYCEENHGELSFPAVVIDPIDGTRGILDGSFESSVSIAVLDDCAVSEKSYGIVYNPFNGYYIDSDIALEKDSMANKKLLKGMVSRTEYTDGLYESFGSDEIFILPMGSIAYKLGLLAGGMIDFVITKKPKNIWDIAAGTSLCYQAGLKLFNHEGSEITEFEELHQPVMLWCKEEDKERILKELKA